MLHRLLDGGIFRWFLSHAPCAGYVVSGIGKRTYQGYLSFLLQWQDAAFVLQKHEGLCSHIAGCLTVLCSINLALAALGVAVAVRVAEQAQFIFRFQNAAAGDIHILLAHLSFCYALCQMLYEGVGAHIHIGTSLQRLF